MTGFDAPASGWLLKRCPVLGDVWRRHWCVLGFDEEEDTWVLDCHAEKSRKLVYHIPLGMGARVLTKQWPTALAKHQQQRPCSFLLDSGEGRLCPFFLFDAVSQDSLSTWQGALSTCARELRRRLQTEEEHLFRSKLWSVEFRRYAESLGFAGSDAEWNGEFNEICEDRGWKEDSSITLKHFTKFVSKDEKMEKEHLQEVLEGLKGERELPVSDAWARQSVASNLVKLKSRSDIITAMFNCLQNVDTGRIGCSELRRYAVLSGFEGDADEWAEEYEDLCADQGWSKDTGISRLEFAGLMKDEQMGSDEELKAILMELRMSPKKRRTFDQMSQLAGKTASRNRVDVTELDRSALVAEAFRCLDVRRKELLTSREFRRYAELTGYDEGEEFWEEQYEELCQEYGWTPEVGVGLREFEEPWRGKGAQDGAPTQKLPDQPKNSGFMLARAWHC
ncbi:unnamed protein product [Effrenium voratum]|uniref:Uncharacterized protein n=1 Tax=Effrenium voratum TaxID=2562239 RepID=A0AA36J339_9DINO|nr:unnamed protein product [Effrenium voratum]